MLTLAQLIALLGADAAFRIANQTRPMASYLWARFLPEVLRPTYHVDEGSMTVRAIMAGLVGMDSAYPQGAVITASRFLEESAKLAQEVNMPEKVLREIQQLQSTLLMTSGGTMTDAIKQQLLNNVMNFIAKVIVQPHIDAAEWMRGQALTYGEIDWTFNGIHLKVDYGIPSGNKLATRTGNDAYGGSTSKFWEDWRKASRLLRWNRTAAICHPNTLDVILDNEVNRLEIVGQTANRFTLRRYRNIMSAGGGAPAVAVPDQDNRYTATIVTYDLEGEVYKDDNSGETVKVPFMPEGVIVHLGRDQRNEYRVGEGSTDDPDNDLQLGYTHVAPTTEGSGQMGRWARVFTPDGAPWSMTGQAASNVLPVIRAPKKVVTQSTALA